MGKYNRMFNWFTCLTNCGPRYVKSERRFQMVVLSIFHILGAVSFYKQSSLPTPHYLSMYAVKACVRPVITKLFVDPPAWFIVSLILGQLFVGACTPKFRDP